MTVPTVERGLWLVAFCSIEMAGRRPSIRSTSGFSISCRNCRAGGRQRFDVTALPFAYRVSNAARTYLEPDSPVITISLSRGRSRLMFLRLWVRARVCGFLPWGSGAETAG